MSFSYLDKCLSVCEEIIKDDTWSACFQKRILKLQTIGGVLQVVFFSDRRQMLDVKGTLDGSLLSDVPLNLG